MGTPSIRQRLSNCIENRHANPGPYVDGSSVRNWDAGRLLDAVADSLIGGIDITNARTYPKTRNYVKRITDILLLPVWRHNAIDILCAKRPLADTGDDSAVLAARNTNDRGFASIIVEPIFGPPNNTACQRLIDIGRNVHGIFRRITKNDRIYAPLPLCKRNCGCNTVIAEDSGVEINGDNLWRWNQHTFGEMPMYKDLPDDLSKLSLADVMRHLQ